MLYVIDICQIYLKNAKTNVNTLFGYLDSYFCWLMQKSYIVKNGRGVSKKALAIKANTTCTFCKIHMIKDTLGYNLVQTYLKLVEYQLRISPFTPSRMTETRSRDWPPIENKHILATLTPIEQLSCSFLLLIIGSILLHCLNIEILYKVDFLFIFIDL